MAHEIFVDASAWVAVANKKDNYHQKATKIYPSIITKYSKLVTTNLVVAEAYTIIRNELGHNLAIQFLEGLNSSRLLQVFADSTIQERSFQILHRYHDQDFSYADAVSFALMQERGIKDAFAFDHHFTVMGFRLVPSN